MSAARGRANHALYLAQILLQAWSEGIDRQELPQRILADAYEPAVRMHLVDAYGWFLLAVSQTEPLPPAPPRKCADLPARPQGIAMPGEISEFRQLETSGWLAELLQHREYSRPVVASRGSLAAPAMELAGPEQLAAWRDNLAAIFERMSESLDEY